MSFNTAIAKMMECTNAMTSADVVDVQDYDTFLTLLNPFLLFLNLNWGTIP